MSLTPLWQRAVAALLILLPCGAAHAQESPRLVELLEGGVGISFTPPPGCRALPEGKLSAAATQGFPVKYGCATPEGDALVFVAVQEAGGRKNALAEFARGYREGHRSESPGGRLLGRRVVKINGGRWVNLRLSEGRAADSRVQDVYLTDWAGRIIVFVFMSPASRYEGRKAALDRSARSIELNLAVIAPATDAAPPGQPGKRPGQ